MDEIKTSHDKKEYFSKPPPTRAESKAREDRAQTERAVLDGADELTGNKRNLEKEERLRRGPDSELRRDVLKEIDHLELALTKEEVPSGDFGRALLNLDYLTRTTNISATHVFLERHGPIKIGNPEEKGKMHPFIYIDTQGVHRDPGGAHKEGQLVNLTPDQMREWQKTGNPQLPKWINLLRDCGDIFQPIRSAVDIGEDPQEKTRARRWPGRAR